MVSYSYWLLIRNRLFSTDSWWKRHPVIVNGKAACDGGARSCRRLNDQQTALLDQWCNAGSKALETPTHTQQREERSEAEGLVESRSFLDVGKTVGEQKTEMEEDNEKLRPEEERQRFHGTVMETGGVCPFMPGGGSSCLSGSYQAAPSSTLGHAGSDNHDLLKSPQPSQACTNGNKFLESTADGAKESGNDGSEVSVQLTSGLFTGENADGSDLGTKESETQVDNSSLVYDLSALLSDSCVQYFTNHIWHQPAPTGWHFPVGIGLSEVADHPLQFPGTSYYHGFQENTNSEGKIFRSHFSSCPANPLCTRGT